jgi:predicted RND superfamily exporter protein
MHKAIVFTGQGIFTGAMTTAAAFLAMALTNFKGIQEMGVICGGGMIVCLIPMMTLLPVMLFRGRQNALDHVPDAHTPYEAAPFRERIERIWLNRPLTVVAITAVITLIALTQFYRIYFDYDLLNMQSAGLPAVVFEKKLIDDTSQSVLFAAVVADNPEQALELEAKLRKLPSVSTNISMAPYLTGDPTEKLKLIGEIKSEVAPVHFQAPDPAPVKLSDLSSTLFSTAGYMGTAVDEIKKSSAPPTSPPAPVALDPSTDTKPTDTNALTDEELIAQLSGLKASINTLRRQMLGMDPVVASEKLGAFQRALFNDVNETFQSIHDQDDSTRLKVEDLPPALRDRFIGQHGKILIQVYPEKDVWEHNNQAEFVKELRTVDPHVTGTPVQLLEYTTLLKDSYIQAAYYALAVIAVMVLIHFRSLTYLALALLPVGIGAIWMGGWMGLFKIPFNPANIMTLPLVIGIGVTNGIHILNRYVEERNPSILSKSTGKAVFVSGLTTLSGFGSLILAKHLGIRSLGEVMAMGVALCMLAALTFLPAVLNLWEQRRNAAKKTTR